MNQAEARVQFADWLKREHPEIFKRAVAIAEKQTQALGALGAEGESFWSKFTKAAAGLGTTYLALKNQRDMMRLNLERARQGQPPLDVATSAPVVRTQVDVSPELTERLVSTAGEGLNKTLLLAGAAVVAVLVFMRKK
jgi:hypothetical protein